MLQGVHSFTTHYDGRTSVLRNEIQIASAFDPRHTKDHPPYKKCLAIWDTGATHSVISEKVIAECNLKPTGIVQVHGISGEKISKTYLVNILLPNGVAFTGVKVTEGILRDTDVLIGMDIINMGDFALTHNDGKTLFSFRIPSIGKIDFVKQTAVGIAISRSAPCPCGSGKKYKKCCGVSP